MEYNYNQLIEILSSNSSIERLNAINYLQKYLSAFKSPNFQNNISSEINQLPDKLFSSNSTQANIHSQVNNSEDDFITEVQTPQQIHIVEIPWDKLVISVFDFLLLEQSKYIDICKPKEISYSKESKTTKTKSLASIKRAYNRFEKIIELCKFCILTSIPNIKKKVFNYLLKKIIENISFDFSGLEFLVSNVIKKKTFFSDNCTILKLCDFINNHTKAIKIEKKLELNQSFPHESTLSLKLDNFYAKLILTLLSTKNKLFEISKSKNYTILILSSINILLKTRFLLNKDPVEPIFNNTEVDIFVLLARLVYSKLDFTFGNIEKVIICFSLFYMDKITHLPNTTYSSLLSLFRILLCCTSDYNFLNSNDLLVIIDPILLNTLAMINKGTSQSCTNLILKIWWVSVKLILDHRTDIIINAKMTENLFSIRHALSNIRTSIFKEGAEFKSVDKYLCEKIINSLAFRNNESLSSLCFKKNSENSYLYNLSTIWTDLRLIPDQSIGYNQLIVNEENIQFSYYQKNFYSCLLENDPITPESKWSNIKWFYLDLLGYLAIFLNDSTESISLEKNSLYCTSNNIKRKRYSAESSPNFSKNVSAFHSPEAIKTDLTEFLFDSNLENLFKNILNLIKSGKEIPSETFQLLTCLLLNYSSSIKSSFVLVYQISFSIISHLSEPNKVLKVWEFVWIILSTKILNIWRAETEPENFLFDNYTSSGWKIFKKYFSTKESNEYSNSLFFSGLALSLLESEFSNFLIADNTSTLQFKSTMSDIFSSLKAQNIHLSFQWIYIIYDFWPHIRSNEFKGNSIDILFSIILQSSSNSLIFYFDSSIRSELNQIDQIKLFTEFSKLTHSTKLFVNSDMVIENCNNNSLHDRKDIINIFLQTIDILDISEKYKLLSKIIAYMKNNINDFKINLWIVAVIIINQKIFINFTQTDKNTEKEFLAILTFLASHYLKIFKKLSKHELFYLSKIFCTSKKFIAALKFELNSQIESFIKSFTARIFFLMKNDCANINFIKSWSCHTNQNHSSIRSGHIINYYEIAPTYLVTLCTSLEFYQDQFEFIRLLISNDSMLHILVYNDLLKYISTIQSLDDFLVLGYKISNLSKILFKIKSNKVAKILCSHLSEILLSSSHINNLSSITIVYKILATLVDPIIYPSHLAYQLGDSVSPLDNYESELEKNLSFFIPFESDKSLDLVYNMLEYIYSEFILERAHWYTLYSGFIPFLHTMILYENIFENINQIETASSNFTIRNKEPINTHAIEKFININSKSNSGIVRYKASFTFFNLLSHLNLFETIANNLHENNEDNIDNYKDRFMSSELYIHYNFFTNLASQAQLGYTNTNNSFTNIELGYLKLILNEIFANSNISHKYINLGFFHNLEISKYLDYYPIIFQLSQFICASNKTYPILIFILQLFVNIDFTFSEKKKLFSNSLLTNSVYLSPRLLESICKFKLKTKPGLDLYTFIQSYLDIWIKLAIKNSDILLILKIFFQSSNIFRNKISAATEIENNGFSQDLTCSFSKYYHFLNSDFYPGILSLFLFKGEFEVADQLCSYLHSESEFKLLSQYENKIYYQSLATIGVIIHKSSRFNDIINKNSALKLLLNNSTVDTIMHKNKIQIMYLVLSKFNFSIMENSYSASNSFLIKFLNNMNIYFQADLRSTEKVSFIDIQELKFFDFFLAETEIYVNLNRFCFSILQLVHKNMCLSYQTRDNIAIINMFRNILCMLLSHKAFEPISSLYFGFLLSNALLQSIKYNDYESIDITMEIFQVLITFVCSTDFGLLFNSPISTGINEFNQKKYILQNENRCSITQIDFLYKIWIYMSEAILSAEINSKNIYLKTINLHKNLVSQMSITPTNYLGVVNLPPLLTHLTEKNFRSNHDYSSPQNNPLISTKTANFLLRNLDIRYSRYMYQSLALIYDLINSNHKILCSQASNLTCDIDKDFFVKAKNQIIFFSEEINRMFLYEDNNAEVRAMLNFDIFAELDLLCQRILILLEQVFNLHLNLYNIIPETNYVISYRNLSHIVYNFLCSDSYELSFVCINFIRNSVKHLSKHIAQGTRLAHSNNDLDLNVILNWLDNTTFISDTTFKIDLEILKLLQIQDLKFTSEDNLLNIILKTLLTSSKNFATLNSLIALAMINTIIEISGSCEILESLKVLIFLSYNSSTVYLSEFLLRLFDCSDERLATIKSNFMNIIIWFVNPSTKYPILKLSSRNMLHLAQSIIKSMVDTRILDYKLLNIKEFIKKFNFDFAHLALVSKIIGLDQFVPFFYELVFCGQKKKRIHFDIFSNLNDADSICTSAGFENFSELRPKKISRLTKPRSTQYFTSMDNCETFLGCEKSLILNRKNEILAEKIESYTRVYDVSELLSYDIQALKSSYLSLDDRSSYLAMISASNMNDVADQLFVQSDYKNLLMFNESTEKLNHRSSPNNIFLFGDSNSNLQNQNDRPYSDTLLMMGLNNILFNTGYKIDESTNARSSMDCLFDNDAYYASAWRLREWNLPQIHDKNLNFNVQNILEYDKYMYTNSSVCEKSYETILYNILNFWNRNMNQNAHKSILLLKKLCASTIPLQFIFNKNRTIDLNGYSNISELFKIGTIADNTGIETALCIFEMFFKQTLNTSQNSIKKLYDSLTRINSELKQLALFKPYQKVMASIEINYLLWERLLLSAFELLKNTESDSSFENNESQSIESKNIDLLVKVFNEYKESCLLSSRTARMNGIYTTSLSTMSKFSETISAIGINIPSSVILFKTENAKTLWDSGLKKIALNMLIEHTKNFKLSDFNKDVSNTTRNKNSRNFSIMLNSVTDKYSLSEIEQSIKSRILCLDDKMATLYEAQVYSYIGEWSAELRTSRPESIIKDYFSKAIELLDESDAIANIAEDTLYSLARFADKNFQQSLEVTDSAKELSRIKLYKTKELTMWKDQLASLQLGAKGLNSDALSTREKNIMIKQISGQIFRLELQVKQDNDDSNKKESESNYYLSTALWYYSRCLIVGNKYNTFAANAIISLWLSNSKNKKAMLTLKKVGISKINSYKWLPLVHQICARLGDLEHLTGLENFQSLLKSVILRMACKHPYHTLPTLFALKNANSDQKIEKAISKNLINNQITKKDRSYELQNEESRIRISEQIINRVSNEKTYLAEIINIYDKLSIAYIQIANATIPEVIKKDALSISGKKTISFNKSWYLSKISKMKNIPILTADLKIDIAGRYEGCIEINEDISIANSEKGITPVTFISKMDLTYKLAGGINLPKIIKIEGTDGLMYRQLIKGRDDLRQDAVIEQLFKLINEILCLQYQAKTKVMRLVTYNVIPLSKRSGVLEWVQNTVPIGTWLTEEYKQIDDKYDLISVRKRMQYEHSNKDSSLETKVELYKKILKQIPPIFRLFFYNASKNVEAYWINQKRYTKSVAVSSIICWLLGIGDRHSQNLLISERTCEIVHIDLGVAFNMGSLLPVPELVPFRLTQNIRDGMGLVNSRNDGNSTFFKQCVDTLNAMRGSKSLIRTVLSVLKHDPLYQWADSGLKIRQVITKQLAREDAASPKSRLIFGASFNHFESVNIIKDQDINEENLIKSEENSREEGNKEAERAILAVVKRLETNISSECQVNELIQDATDIWKLARMFSGWQAWL
ncbi:hypothetical protein BB561_005189 [Smittium simulii]|uniref:Serine/threonine-protein kinase TEL1 n=1 Tax=Smittium simulii TaxID=133385 RepID=A0A2T9YBK5_9FUNG|nr:hypothetical protein BB561_005189 [Smittium simulii]